MKRYYLRSLVLFAIFMSFTVALYAAEIAYIEGNVQVQPSSQEAWRKAELGMQVNTGDSIRTARRSKVDIVLDKVRKHSIRVEEKTLLVLNSSYPGSINRLDLSHGKVYANVEQVMAGFNFEVTTPSSIAGVRGTVYSTESTPKRDEVASFKDTVHVQTFDARRNLVSEMEVPEKFKTQIDRFGAASMLTELTVREMQKGDQVKEDLVRRVEEGPAKVQEKTEGPESEIEAELKKAQEAVEIIAKETSQSKEQIAEQISETVIEETRGGGGCHEY